MSSIRHAGLALALLTVVGVAAWQAHGILRARDAERFAAEMSRVDTAIAERMATYVQVVRAGVGLFRASEDVSRAEWLTYVEALRLHEHYPGFKSLSVAPLVMEEDLQAFIANVRAEELRPVTSRPRPCARTLCTSRPGRRGAAGSIARCCMWRRTT